MAQQSGELHCAVITPDRQVLDVTARSAILPAHDGLVGVLRDRAPLLCKLGIGVLRLEVEGRERQVFIDGGFAQVLDNEVTVLTPTALEPAQIERDSAEAALNAALNMRITDDESFQARADALARARAQLSLVG